MLHLVTADDRLRASINKMTALIVGRPKVGKTSLLHTLRADSTICLDFEAGMKSVQTWKGHSIPIRSWGDALDIAVLLTGPDFSRSDSEPFSVAHYDYVRASYAEKINPTLYRVVFVDSITEVTRVAMEWAKRQPAAFSERTGKPDPRGAYGLLGRSVIELLKHIQRAPGKDVIFIAGLDRRVDEFGREIFEIQTEGAKTGAELPYIVDQIITMSDFDYDAGSKTWSHNIGKGANRAFVCRSPNPWALPAGDRSGNLDIIEEPHLGRLIEKINETSKTASERLQFARPDGSPAAIATPESVKEPAYA
jgi:hypothetical protein